MSIKLGILALLEAKPGKEETLAELLRSAQALAVKEAHDRLVCVPLRPAQLRYLRLVRRRGGPQRPSQGEIARRCWVGPRAFASPPDIRKVDVIALK
jgi:hypothetical protein